MKKLLYMYKFTGKYWLFAILCPIAMVGEALLELQVPEKIGDMIDYLTLVENTGATPEMSKIIMIGLIILLYSFLSLACGLLGGILASVAASGFSMNLKNEIFTKVQSFSFTNIDKYNTSSLITRITTDTNWITNSFQMSIRMLFRSPALFIYAMIKASQVSKDISMIYLYCLPVLIIGLIVIFALSHPQFEKGIRLIDKLNERVEENVRGIRAVKSFTREKAEIDIFDENNNKLYKIFSKAQMIVNLNSPLMSITIYAALLIIMIMGSLIIGSGEVDNLGNQLMTSGDLYKMISYTMQILTSLMFISMIFAMMIISKPSRDRVYEVLHETPTIKNKENPITEIKDGSIEFKNVNFKYSETSENYVLKNINLKVKSGETLGILGTTGSSKTTLVSLIARLYDTKEGEIIVSNNNVKDYDLTALRDAVSVVLQKNVLFSGTIKDNLKWGNENATDEEVLNAAKIAQADSFVSLFKDKYDTYIEQGGTNVSGGQKQRLCIARAILKNPKILILDDSMSAVDTKTDKLIREGLKKYKPDITKIIVAQRCQSVMDADKIIILDNGSITDIGTHQELLKNSKNYQEIYYSQNKEEK